jgi:hypothetical protein
MVALLSAIALRGRNGVNSFSLRPSSISIVGRTTTSSNDYSTTTTLSAKGGGGGDGGGGRKKRPKNPFASTIILPETGFSQRANAIVREVEIQKFWSEYGLYDKLSETAKEASKDRFVLHDGPPYANGSLHCGHALNKILKDFINRKQALNGKQVHYIPGWDCHGLPIELKVLQTMKSKERQALTPITLREKAATFAKKTVEEQSKSFQRYGIFGDFEKPYLTLQPEFEAAQIRVFGEMFQKGFIFRGRKPVHWSPSSRTALAEAELEYPENHISKSIYVAFEIVEASDALKEYHSTDKPVKVAIWTTTPWTMPANMAVAVNPDLSYSVVNHESTGKLIVATDLIETIAVRYLFDDNVDDKLTATINCIVFLLVKKKKKYPHILSHYCSLVFHSITVNKIYIIVLILLLFTIIHHIFYYLYTEKDRFARRRRIPNSLQSSRIGIGWNNLYPSSIRPKFSRFGGRGLYYHRIWNWSCSYGSWSRTGGLPSWS